MFDTYNVIEYTINSKIMYASALDEITPNCSGVNWFCIPKKSEKIGKVKKNEDKLKLTANYP